MSLQQTLTMSVIDGMEAKGWTRRQLAHEAYVSETHLSEVLRGAKGASVEMWDSLLRAVDRRLEAR